MSDSTLDLAFAIRIADTTEQREANEFEDSGEGERAFRRERERHSGPKANSSRSVATLAF